LCKTLRKKGDRRKKERGEKRRKNRRSKTKGIVEGRFHSIHR